MLIVIHRQSGEELDRVLEALCSKLDVSYTYIKEHHKIILERRLLHDVEILGRYCDPLQLSGLRPDFYNVDSEFAGLMLSQGTSKVHGI